MRRHQRIFICSVLLILTSCSLPQTIEIDEEESMTIEFVRELNLPYLLQAVRHKFISAASGLVRAHGAFYAVSDDENHLVRIPEDGKIPCQTYPIFSGALPADSKNRKKKKPDLEAIAFIEPSEKFKHGALLLIPSGSEMNRMRGALFPFTAKEKLAAHPQEFNLSELYAQIKRQIGDINIEGAVVTKNNLKLFSRGNGKGTKNALIDVDFTLNPLNFSFHKATPIDLGVEQDFPIAFTDATVSPQGEIWFLAVAEATNTSYEDGKFLAGFIGKLNVDNKVEFLSKEKFPQKPEGIFIDEANGKRKFYFVTDADDNKTASQLLVGN